MTITVGVGGVATHACAAISDGTRILAACEQERVTRVRGDGLNASGLPDAALDFLLHRLNLSRAQIRKVAVGESSHTPSLGNVVCFDHHRSHAAASYLTSPFERAAIVVCDHQAPETSVWIGDGARIERVDWPWNGIGLATLYSNCAEAFGFPGDAQAAHLEALARLRPRARDERLGGMVSFQDDSIALSSDWRSRLASVDVPAALAGGRLDGAAAFAAAVQNEIGDLLEAFLKRVRERTGETRLCLAGSLFFNTHFCALAKRGGVFEKVFVPVNPGNAGLALGTALHADDVAPRLTTPFLGPSFDSEEVKSTLDNCKLTYEWVGEHAATVRAVEALTRGSLVGWFRGAMEWGPRALGARSILASPFSPYVLENLNRFLKQRKPWRGYALTGLQDEIERHFDEYQDAPFMECDFQLRNREQFRHIMPHADAAIRVQTVAGERSHPLHDVLKLFGQATGTSVLVNTSFNGFSEPIVCTPRDAIRVFYGTGLDMLVINEFVLTK